MDEVTLVATAGMDLGTPRLPNPPRFEENGYGEGTVSTARANTCKRSTKTDRREPDSHPIMTLTLVLAPAVESRSGSTEGKQRNSKGQLQAYLRGRSPVGGDEWRRSVQKRWSTCVKLFESVAGLGSPGRTGDRISLSVVRQERTQHVRNGGDREDSGPAIPQLTRGASRSLRTVFRGDVPEAREHGCWRGTETRRSAVDGSGDAGVTNQQPEQGLRKVGSCRRNREVGDGVVPQGAAAGKGPASASRGGRWAAGVATWWGAAADGGRRRRSGAGGAGGRLGWPAGFRGSPGRRGAAVGQQMLKAGGGGRQAGAGAACRGAAAAAKRGRRPSGEGEERGRGSALLFLFPGALSEGQGAGPLGA